MQKEDLEEEAEEESGTVLPAASRIGLPIKFVGAQGTSVARRLVPVVVLA